MKRRGFFGLAAAAPIAAVVRPNTDIEAEPVDVDARPDCPVCRCWIPEVTTEIREEDGWRISEQITTVQDQQVHVVELDRELLNPSGCPALCEYFTSCDGLITIIPWMACQCRCHEHTEQFMDAIKDWYQT